VRVYGLVPAAGRSRRFGSDKLLAKWQNRELLGHVLLRLSEARAMGLLVGVVVVHRPGDDAVRALAREYRGFPVEVRDPEGELSYSLRTGIEAIEQRGTAHDREAVLVCHGDQPALRLDVIHALVTTWQRGGALAVRPGYRESPGEPGLPMVIDRSLWSLGREMRGDTGFAPVLARHGVVVRTVPVGGRNPDVDTPDDLAALDMAAPAGHDVPSILDPP
jgi:molybdenum cofactor cytidylyltransferase